MSERSSNHPNPGGRDLFVIVIDGPETGRMHGFESPLTLGVPRRPMWPRRRLRGHGAILTVDSSGVRLDASKGVYVNEREVPYAILEAGDIVRVGDSTYEVIRRNSAEFTRAESLYRLSTVDEPTHLYNQRYFADTLEREVQRARRYDRSLSLLMLDITHREPVNDHTLRQIGDSIRGCLRKVDVPARLDDTVFAVLMPEVELRAAATVGESIHEAIEQCSFGSDGQALSVEVSLGVAQLEPHGMTADGLLRLAATRMRRL